VPRRGHHAEEYSLGSESCALPRGSTGTCSRGEGGTVRGLPSVVPMEEEKKQRRRSPGVDMGSSGSGSVQAAWEGSSSSSGRR
jgi:hypothetical protein